MNINRTALAAFIGWIIYNAFFASIILIWIKATWQMWAWASFPVLVVSIFMFAITMGSQNKDR